ncbi:glycine betaine ABC transporter substrate-binding protein [Salinicoccus roseus]|uniref:glycine betaine ABC transporter substrate-binding protein n=1 Tax=Salinicoccus roseus TaxID=45670 RepID=UPI001EF68914|nr:glycine betaine ABC transporter substrate-binding protein [Salinicoccus roseus]MCG7332570.1 glycine betaine ABC transporter substrate-binding protein [Salinicoccus roseus]
MKKIYLLLLASMTAIVLAACGGGGEEEQTEEAGNGEGGSELGQETIEIPYVEWDSEIASTHVIQKVLETEGYDVEITPLDNAVMWQSVASGDTDAMVSAWVPLTHGDLYDEHESSLDDLGPNLEGAKIGLVVPEDFPVDSITDLSDEAGQQVTGIEPGAGVVQAAEDAVETYDNLEGWEVQTSSSGAMATELGQAIDNGEEIIVTGWTPHWKFQTYDLKYLEDPEGVFGEAETINTLAREGLEEDAPRAYEILDNFYWETGDMEEVMLEIEDGADPSEAAQNWIDENQDTIDEWLQASE